MNTSNITNYKPKDFAELLGVSVKTLQRWDREGILKANRTPTDRRYYTYDQYLQFKGINIEHDKRKVVIYARVSTKNQRDDLQNQTAFLRQFCNARGMIVDQCIEDYGSGLNYNRKHFLSGLCQTYSQVRTGCCFANAAFLVGDGDDLCVHDFTSFLIVAVVSGNRKSRHFKINSEVTALSIAGIRVPEMKKAPSHL